MATVGEGRRLTTGLRYTGAGVDSSGCPLDTEPRHPALEGGGLEPEPFGRATLPRTRQFAASSTVRMCVASSSSRVWAVS